MKNTFGNSVALTVFGESHGSEIGAVLDGLAPGIKVDEDYIAKKLSLRRPFGKISIPRILYHISQGFARGKRDFLLRDKPK